MIDPKARNRATLKRIDWPYILTLRHARNLCWADWHAPDRKMYERQQSKLGYKILQRRIEAELGEERPVPETMRRVYLDGAWKPL